MRKEGRQITIYMRPEDRDDLELVQKHLKKSGISLNHFVRTSIHEMAMALRGMGLHEKEPSEVTVRDLAEMMQQLYGKA
jgi:hypothetical protein